MRKAAMRRNFRCAFQESTGQTSANVCRLRCAQLLQEELATLESNLRELAGEEGSVPSLVALYKPSAAGIPEAARRAQNERELSQLSDSAHLLQQRHTELTGQMTHLQTALQQKQGSPSNALLK